LEKSTNIDSIGFLLHIYPCCNHCRYCCWPKHLDNLPFYRYVRVMERFLDWKEREGRVKTISSHILWTHALMTYDQSKKFRELSFRGGYHPLELQMDGCIFMPEDDLERILEGHRRAGYDRYSMTLTGFRDLHDLWAGRKGEFDFLMLMAKIAARLGYERQENILISQSSIPQLQQLTDCLDSLSGKRIRFVKPVGYGMASHYMEKERITRADIPRIPPNLLPYTDFAFDDKSGVHPYRLVKTEKEWISWIQNHSVEVQHNTSLGIHMESGNIDYLESASCDDICKEYFEQHIKELQQMPEIVALCDKYGDPSNEKLYHLYEIDSKWTHAYRVEHNLPLL